MTIKRYLHCDNPNCPWEKQHIFSDWIRENLPDSKDGYVVSDLDFILADNKTKKIKLLEAKIEKAVLRPWQYDLFKNIEKWIKNGINIDKEWTFYGFDTLRFEKTSPEDGRMLLNNKEITKEELLWILKMK